MANPFIWLQHALPHHAVSRLAGKFAGAETPWLKDRLIRRFIDAYDVDMTEAARPVEAYASFNDFFTRELKPGARPLADADEHILSPADGAISQIGRIEEGRLFQAKGREFTAAQLLGGDPVLAERFEGGAFATIYLSPKDYHRVHMPAAGELLGTIYVPGDLFSVREFLLFEQQETALCAGDLLREFLGDFLVVVYGALEFVSARGGFLAVVVESLDDGSEAFELLPPPSEVHLQPRDGTLDLRLARRRGVLLLTEATHAPL